MADAAILHGLLQKAGRAHLDIEDRRACPYTVEKLSDRWIVKIETRGLVRWKKVAEFFVAEALADFLVASLTTPEDHL